MLAGQDQTSCAEMVLVGEVRSQARMQGPDPCFTMLTYCGSFQVSGIERIGAFVVGLVEQLARFSREAASFSTTAYAKSRAEELVKDLPRILL